MWNERLHRYRNFSSFVGKVSVFTLMLFSMSIMLEAQEPVQTQMFETQNKPLFEPNKGQVKDLQGNPQPQVQYIYEASGMLVAFQKNGISYTAYTKSESSPRQDISEATGKSISQGNQDSTETIFNYHRIDMQFIGANENPEIIPAGRSRSYKNYYLSSSAEGSAEVYGYAMLTYKDIYPNIDFVLYSNGGNKNLKYDIVVHPGGDLSQVKMAYEGMEGMALRDNQLHLVTTQGEVTETIPESYMEQSGEKVEVKYDLKGNVVSFSSASSTAGETLIIDPLLQWSTYLGGSNVEGAAGIISDISGAIYVTGTSFGGGFPTTAGAYQQSNPGSEDVFVSKFSSSGNLLWSTYLGGSGEDEANALAIDTTGVLITGFTGSNDFPTLSAYQDTLAGNQDAFLARFSENGLLSWSTYYGGGGTESGVALTCSGSIIKLLTDKSDFTSTGLENTFDLSTFNIDGSYLQNINSINFSGSLGNEDGLDLLSDASGNTYLTALARYSGFPGLPTGQYGGVVLMKFSNANNLLWSSYVGGGGNVDYAYINLGGDNNIYLTGTTTSSNFPVSSGAYQSGTNGGLEGFIQKYDASGNRKWSSYFGGGSDDYLFDVVTDSENSIYVTGRTNSFDFPVTPGAYQDSKMGPASNNDAVLSKFDSSGTLLYSTFFGGFANDGATSLDIDASGNIWMAGGTRSTDFPTTSGAYQPSLGGSQDVFLTKFKRAEPEIAVKGAGQFIPNGKMVPTATDSTDFGISSNPISVKYQIYNTGIDTLYILNTSITGADPSQFTLSLNSTGIAPGDSLSLPVTYNPSDTGVYHAIVNIVNTDASNSPFTFAITAETQTAVQTITNNIWQTYAGGSDNDEGFATAVDASGNVYIAGYTGSNDFQVSGGAYQSSNNGGDDAFLVKFDNSGNLLWSTYLGGGADDEAHDLAIDNSGNVYVVGLTQSSDFPVSGAFQATFGGNTDAFLSKFTSSGSLSMSTYLGGSGTDFGYGIAVDDSANIYLTGYTSFSNDFPISNAFQSGYGGDFSDAFLSRISSSGTLDWSTYLGGSGTETGEDIHFDGNGSLIVTGATRSINFPVSAAYQSSIGGGEDAFLASFTTGGNLTWSTYIGGSGTDRARGVSIDNSGDVVISGYSFSSNFPTTAGAYQTGTSGTPDAFAGKFDAAGNLLWSTYIGGSGNDYGSSVAVDSENNLIITGYTGSSDFPVSADAGQSVLSGGLDAFVMRLNSSGSTVDWSSYLGGSSDERGYGIAVDDSGQAFITGYTLSSDFPVTNVAWQTAYGGNWDAFAAKVTFTTPPAPDIAVKGNGTTITDGQTNTSFNDNTDFGSTTVGNPVSVNYWVYNEGLDTLLISNTTINGASAGNFSILLLPASTILPGDSSLMQISYDPVAAGSHSATVEISSNDPIESPFTFAVVGNTGICPPAERCTYYINLIDSFGDGWNGNEISLYQNGIAVATFGANFTSGSSLDSVPAELCDSLPTHAVVSTLGSWSEEVGFEIWSPSGQLAATYNPGFDFDLGDTLVSFTSYCDSITCNTMSSIEATTCDSYTSPSGNYTWTSSGTYFDTIPNAAGCDSIITIELTVRAGIVYIYNNGWVTPLSNVLPCDTMAILDGTAALGSSYEISYLVIRPNANLDLNSTTLTVNDTAIIQADSSGYGQVIGDINGEVTWQTYLSSSSPRWYNNAFPVRATVNDISGALINVSQDAGTQNIYAYDATLDDSGEGTWVFASTTDSLGRNAYEIFLSNAFGGSTATLSVWGEPLNGNINIPLYRNVNGANSDGWNYIPNPYPSSLDFDLLMNQNAGVINNTYYIQLGSPGTTSYCSYNSTHGTGAGTSVAGTKDLAPGQAFFVQAASDGTANLQFTNSQRNFAQTPLFKQSGAKIDLLKLRAAKVQGPLADETVIGFHQNFTSQEDGGGADAKKILNYGFPNLYTTIGTEAYIYQGLDNQFSSHTEPVFFESDSAGTYEIALAQDAVPADWTIHLEDKLSGKTTNLRQGNYSFYHAKGNAADRFLLHINKLHINTQSLSTASDIYAFTNENLLYVNLEDRTGQVSLALYDMSGKLVHKEKNISCGQVYQHNINRLAAGIYLVKVYSASGTPVHVQKVNK